MPLARSSGTDRGGLHRPGVALIGTGPRYTSVRGLHPGNGGYGETQRVQALRRARLSRATSTLRNHMGNIDEREICGVADLAEAISETAASWEGPIWYRGHGKECWPLVPAFYRYESPKRSEHALLIKFRQSATMLVERPASDSFDWMFQMQHYGVPTRLLDWSESPLVALYFSVTSHEAKDGALWILNPSRLNKNAHIQTGGFDGDVPSFHDTELQSYTIESLRGSNHVNLDPVATIATRNNARIQAQQGVFTIHHKNRIAIESVGDGSHVRKLTIASGNKKAMRRELELLGFSRFQLFPELESVGRLLQGEMR